MMAIPSAPMRAQSQCKLGHLTFRVTALDCGVVTWGLYPDDTCGAGKAIATGFVENDLPHQFDDAKQMVAGVVRGAEVPK
ncbi:hypothetical protein [Pelagimonas varians]|uniref:Uncharacterized protein n=1 Tax=Pelagimonas varians TaxID=696760 RepID=A0A238JYG4_9RHOB|nr:hypothetical protein [Pelagimonas varians]PYG33107.1 hypothetical protein C8N36_102102 [Pelagimonas varians]SMX35700.1 hypothetical protein PEV8663_00564 [Pelagimonas varians]